MLSVKPVFTRGGEIPCTLSTFLIESEIQTQIPLVSFGLQKQNQKWNRVESETNNFQFLFGLIRNWNPIPLYYVKPFKIF